MIIERSRNARRNVASGMINRVLTIIVPFITRTFLLRVLGAEYLGLNSLFVSVLQVLNISELGFSSAIVYCLYQPIAEDEYDTIRSILMFLKKAYSYIGAFILVAGVLISPFLPFLISGDYPEEINIYCLYYIYLFNSSASYLFGGYRISILNAIQRNDIVLTVQSVIQLITGVCQIVVLLLYKNYYMFVSIVPILTILNNIIVYKITKKRYPDFYPCGQISNEEKKIVIKKIKGLLANKICQVSRNGIDSICISAFLGLTMTALYTNYFYVIMALITISNVITTSLLSGVGNSMAVETKDKNYEDMRRLNNIYMTYTAITTTCFFVLIQPFMIIWVGEELTYSNDFVWALTAYYYALNMGNIRALYSDAAGLWWENRWRALIETLANVVLNVLMVKIWGLIGIVLATVLTVVIINFGFGSSIIFKHYFENDKLKTYLLENLYMGFKTLVVCVSTGLIVDLIGFSASIVGFLLKCIFCAFLGTCITIFLNSFSVSYRSSLKWLLTKLRS